MSNKRITDLTELTNPTTDDVFPVVDIATNTTTKVQLGNLPVPSSVTTALATKQDSLVSGTNIKTINSTSVLGSGNIAVQETLVSGTNIKTLNNTSLLGSGNITLTANPSGVSGAIQFSNGSAFASDAANLFWDDTNNRLGVGTNAPTASIHATTFRSSSINDTGTVLQLMPSYNTYTFAKFTIGAGDLAAQLGIKGSGSTSATTSLLVQNSAGTAVLTVKDDRTSNFNGFIGGNNGILIGAQTHTNVNPAEVCAHFFYRRDSSGAFQSGFDLSTSTIQAYGSLGVGSSPVASAILQADSTTKGFLPPRGTNTQMNAISSPATGLVFYDTTNNKLCCYNGSTWNDLF
jgi:hypothetical protein